MIKITLKTGLLATAALGLLAACNPDAEPSGSEIIPQAPAGSPAASLGDAERQDAPTPMTVPQDVLDLHQSMLVMDTHLDTPAYFHTPDYDFSVRQSLASSTAARINWSRFTPASRSTSASSASIEWMRFNALMSMTSPPPFWALSP